MSDRLTPIAARLAGAVPRLLGWTPDAFWNATPAELAAILRPPGDESAPVTRDDLNRLMEGENHG